MQSINENLNFFMQLAKLQSTLARKFDARLGGLAFVEFAILAHLESAEGGKLRRVDLAEKIGLTASGVTRLLIPMEKIGLVGRETNEHDARVSYATIAPGGKTKLTEALDRADLVASEVLTDVRSKQIVQVTEVLELIGKSA